MLGRELLVSTSLSSLSQPPLTPPPNTLSHPAAPLTLAPTLHHTYLLDSRETWSGAGGVWLDNKKGFSGRGGSSRRARENKGLAFSKGSSGPKRFKQGGGRSRGPSLCHSEERHLCPGLSEGCFFSSPRSNEVKETAFPKTHPTLLSERPGQIGGVLSLT